MLIELGTWQHHVPGGSIGTVESLCARREVCLQVVVAGFAHVHTIGDCADDHAALPGRGQSQESR
eukprot:13689381-Alexandrium_andersonii.AAC.1